MLCPGGAHGQQGLREERVPRWAAPGLSFRRSLARALVTPPRRSTLGLQSRPVRAPQAAGAAGVRGPQLPSVPAPQALLVPTEGFPVPPAGNTHSQHRSLTHPPLKFPSGA